MKANFADILKDLDKRRNARLAHKLPDWEKTDGLEYPDSLCLEQCSSSISAGFKANLLGLPGKGGRIADLTGGLGVDSLAFARKGWKVMYFERKPELAAAAGNNFRILGYTDIETRNMEISQDSADWKTELESFAPDWIYMDPARRDDCGKKVFLLEDCSPDIMTLMPYLWSVAKGVMIKVSPMADLSMLSSRLGERLESIHIVELEGEVKELLCILKRDCSRSEPDIIVDKADGRATLQLSRSIEKEADAVLCAEGLPESGYIYEGGAAITKSGAFKYLCHLGEMKKLDVSTHLYYRDSPLQDKDLRPFLKEYEIKALLPFSKEGFRQVAKQYPQAETSARNVPLSSEQLRMKCRIKPGGNIHIFACSVAGQRLLVVTERRQQMTSPENLV